MRSRTITTLAAKGKRRPLKHAIGCAREPLDWKPINASAAPICSLDDMADVDRDFDSFMDKEVLDLTGGNQADSLLAEVPRTIVVPAVANQSGFPSADAVAHTCRTLQAIVAQWIIAGWLDKPFVARELLQRMRTAKPTRAMPPLMWMAWRAEVKKLSSRCTSSHQLALNTAYAFRDWLGTLTAEKEEAAIRERMSSWNVWCKEQAKGRPSWDRSMECDGDEEASLQTDADARASEWHDVWQINEVVEELVWPPMDEDVLDLPAMQTFDEFGKLVGTYAEKTSTGVGSKHPRLVAFLSVAAFDVLMFL